ncbi:MAG TPA: lactate utilization protein [Terriglobales bacterium]|nr:lactate utilization protein [Terriglobales bacterium]
MSARTEFLARIRGQLAKTPALFTAAPSLRPARPREVADTIRRELAERWRESLDRFQREFERVGGVLHRVADVQDVPVVVGRLARERGASSVVAWHPSALGFDPTPGLAAEQLTVHGMPDALPDAEHRRALRETIATTPLGLTGVDLALAETGTMILRSGPGRPRSTSLLPATHIAVFDRRVLVESLAQVGVLLEAWHTEEAPGAVINFITGPSRTADIELTLTRGVHGPKEVHAIFVERPIGE